MRGKILLREPRYIDQVNKSKPTSNLRWDVYFFTQSDLFACAVLLSYTSIYISMFQLVWFSAEHDRMDSKFFKAHKYNTLMEITGHVVGNLNE